MVRKNSKMFAISWNKIFQLTAQPEIRGNFNFTLEKNLSFSIDLRKRFMGAIKVQIFVQLIKLFFNHYDCFHI